ncbi:ABC transporter permease [Patulibacter sp. NPDC049589]|uniref:ABC transporter permease n=1 Tax=Patulibacter sp. NPDC049589 TaxID=3154731 RepID=UPI0034283A39
MRGPDSVRRRATGLLGRRALLALLTLWLVSLVVFGAVELLPGDAATTILGKEATPGRLEALRRQLHLEDGIVHRYLQWLGGVLRGDLGTSAATGSPVTELLGPRLSSSVLLVLLAAAVTVPLGVGLGVLGAVRRDRPVDHVLGVGMLVFHALPEFVVGILLVLVFATQVLHVLPAVSLLPPGDSAWAHLDVVVLPAATLVLTTFAYIGRATRAAMVDVLERDHVRLARLNGLPERQVIWGHAFPNALPAVIQVVALQFAWLSGGVVVVEFVFSFPGIGAALVEAVRNRDVQVVQAIALGTGAVYVAVNLLADVATTLATPRLRTAAAR